MKIRPYRLYWDFNDLPWLLRQYGRFNRVTIRAFAQAAASESDAPIKGEI